ncbi:MAG TPA: POTRA domain-containing protein, partial [Pyrinomonadaceae bacterium]|nr:POTRA domain-containing protein [Pyrinomonadaceae bacterium]
MRNFRFLILAIAFALLGVTAHAQVGDYEGRPVSTVDVVLEGTPADATAQSEFKGLLKVVAGSEYSAVSARQSLHDLYASGRIASARVEIDDAAGGARLAPIHVRFVVQRQVIIAGVTIRIGPTTGTPVARDEIRARLNLLEPGRRFSIPAIEKNADEIQTYMRDRGYYKATVEHAEIPDPGDATGTRRIVVYTITPNEQAHVGKFDITIDGFDPAPVRPSLKLQTGAPFTVDVLGDDVNRVKQALIAKNNMAPQLKEPDVKFDLEKNEINIDLKGSAGPKVEVSFLNYTLKESTQQKLLPLKREGNLDYSVIDEGRRRVQLQLQEQGYFFAEVTPLCTVTPPTPNTVQNGSEETCHELNPAGLDGSTTIKIVYDVNLRRRLRLSDIRITGTNKLTVEDILPQLKSRKASAFAFIPFLGAYGRGFTSNALLEEDRRTVEALMRDLGYRRVKAGVLQGISPTQDDLIITFQVTEGPLTRVAEIQIQG